MQYKAKGRCWFWEPHTTHKCNVISVENFFLILNMVVRKVTAGIKMLINNDLLRFISLLQN